MEQYKYKFHNTKKNSAWFGKCQVCKLHASEVWSMTEDTFQKPNHLHPNGWWMNTGYVLGHKPCLEGGRKGEI
jgi:hypothetical protein